MLHLTRFTRAHPRAGTFTYFYDGVWPVLEYSPHQRVQYCDQRVCTCMHVWQSVCVSVCSFISEKHDQISPNFVYVLPLALTKKINKLNILSRIVINGSLTLPVWFRCDDTADLFSRVCVWLYPGCICCLLFFIFCFCLSVYLALRVRFNNK